MLSRDGLWSAQHLSPDILVHVFQFLSSRDVCKVSSVCSSWRRAAEGIDWEGRYRALWGCPERSCDDDQAACSRAAYCSRMERAKAMTLRGARCGGQSHPRTIKSVQMLPLAGIVVTGEKQWLMRDRYPCPARRNDYSCM